MVLCDIRQRLDEHSVPVQAFDTLDTLVVCLVDDLLVELVERLDMVTGESDWDQNEVGLALLDVVGDGVARLSAEPGGRADLGLPYEAVRVAVIEAGHHCVDGGGDFGGIWITFWTALVRYG